MSLTREDMLRELELLPAWKLRVPAPDVVNRLGATGLASTKTDAQAAPVAADMAGAVAQALNLRAIVTDDARYMVVLSPLQTADEETLLQNMLKAMQANPRVDIGLQGRSDLSVHKATIMIVMGENAAQTLGLSGTRGHLLQTEFGQAIITFTPAQLLANPADKAQAWADLCLAIKTT